MIGLSRGSSIVAAGADGKALVLWTLWTQRTKRNGRQHHGCRETVGSVVSIRADTSVICPCRYGSHISSPVSVAGDHNPTHRRISQALELPLGVVLDGGFVDGGHGLQIGRASCRGRACASG